MKSIIENILSLQKDYSSKNTDSMQKRGILIRNSLPEILESFEDEIVQSVGIDINNLIIEGRDGSGNKTEIPWVRFANKELSPSATIGWYVVFLFDFKGNGVYLCLSHGASTWTGQDFEIRPEEELIKKSKWGRSIIKSSFTRLEANNIVESISLNALNSPLGPAYEKSTALAKYYDGSQLPTNESIKKDILIFGNLLKEIYINSIGTQHVGELPEELDEALNNANASAGKKYYQRTAGFRTNQKQKKAIENHAMKKAKETLAEKGFLFQKDTSSTEPYDFLFKDEKEKIYVEVKGTTSFGEQIILTKNEVKLHKDKFPNNILVIVYNIKLSGKNKDVASGGEVKIIYPWSIEEDHLEPLSYKYDIK